MNRFCTACGKPLEGDIQFCGACGKPLKKAAGTPAADASPPKAEETAPPAPDPVNSPPPRAFDEEPPESVFAAAPASSAGIPPEPDPAYFEDNGERSDRMKYLIGGGVIFLLIIAGFYYWLFLSDDVGRNEGGRPTAAATEPKEKAAEAQVFYATSSANIRDKASTADGKITGKLKRAAEVKGTLIKDEDGGDWLKLEDNQGFVFAANLSANEMPAFAKSFGRKSITLAAPVELWSSPTEGSELVDRLSKGLTINVSGITENDYAEVILRKGGVGYIANGAKVVKDGDGPKGPAIAIKLDVQKCASGPDIKALFAKLDGRYKSALKKIEDADYPDDDARDAAIEKFQLDNEGKSVYLAVQRSFKGLQMTGIARHYESQSVYFAEPPAKVIAVFKGLGEKISDGGQLQSRDIYAGIDKTNGKGATIGKSDLGCGV